MDLTIFISLRIARHFFEKNKPWSQAGSLIIIQIDHKNLRKSMKHVVYCSHFKQEFHFNGISFGLSMKATL